jgi:hypothetical protein
MSKTAAGLATATDAEDFEGDVGLQVEDVEEQEPVWPGRRTRVKVAHPMQRHHTIVGPGTVCADCGGPDHQLCIRACRVDGRLVGPESAHLLDLIHDGYVAGTREARDRGERQREIDDLRGVQPSNRCRNCREPLPLREPVCPHCKSQNGFPDLAERTTSQLRREHAPVLKGATDAERAQHAHGIEDEQKAEEERHLKKLQQTVEAIPEKVAAGLVEGLKPIVELAREVLAAKEPTE